MALMVHIGQVAQIIWVGIIKNFFFRKMTKFKVVSDRNIDMGEVQTSDRA